MSPVAVVELANRLAEEKFIKTPEEFVDFLNNPNSEKNQRLVYKMYEQDQNSN